MVIGLRALRAAILCRTPSSLDPSTACDVIALGTTAAGIATLREIRRAAFRLRQDRSRTKSLTVLFGTGKLKFICEDVCDIPRRQHAAAQLVYQFAVRLQTRVPRFLRHLAQNVLEFTIHMRSNFASICAGQRPDKNNPLRKPPEPKPRGLGMVSV